MKQKLELLKELESKSTKGPWTKDFSCPEKQNAVAYVRGIDIFGKYGATARGDEADFIIELRNALPDIISYIEKQSKIIAVAKGYINDCANNDIDDDMLENFVAGDDYEAIMLARKVKTEIEKIEKGE